VTVVRGRPLVVACTLALVPVTGCGAQPLSPLPVQGTPPPVGASAPPTPGSTTPSGLAAAPPPTTRPRTTRTRTTRPRTTYPTAPPQPTTPSASSSPVCIADRYDLNLQETVLDVETSMCFHTGGVLRMFSIGPGLVTAVPESLRAMSYEAAVVDIRFLRPGTVTVTVPQDEQTYTIEVTVID
jgi:hypothetical protein